MKHYGTGCVAGCGEPQYHESITLTEPRESYSLAHYERARWLAGTPVFPGSCAWTGILASRIPTPHRGPAQSGQRDRGKGAWVNRCGQCLFHVRIKIDLNPPE